MKILLASDHAGFELKGKIAAYIQSLGYEVTDMGPHEFNPEDDYPDYIKPLAQKICDIPNAFFGFIFGGSGQGEAIAANHSTGVRAAVYYGCNMDIVRFAREHNNANILSMGAWFVSEEEAKAAVDLFLSTPFGNDERHIRRIQKIK